MADESQQNSNEKQKNFNRLYFWGMVVALIAILAIYYIFAFSMQVHHGHGQADPGTGGGQSVLVLPGATVA